MAKKPRAATKPPSIKKFKGFFSRQEDRMKNGVICTVMKIHRRALNDDTKYDSYRVRLTSNAAIKGSVWIYWVVADGVAQPHIGQPIWIETTFALNAYRCCPATALEVFRYRRMVANAIASIVPEVEVAQ